MSATAFFPLPIAFEPDDQYWMDYASKLIRGEDVQITWLGSTTQCDRDQVRFFLEETAEVGEAFTFFNRSQEILKSAGVFVRCNVLSIRKRVGPRYGERLRMAGEAAGQFGTSVCSAPVSAGLLGRLHL